MPILQRAVIALLATLGVSALASASLAQDRFRPGVSLDDDQPFPAHMVMPAEPNAPSKPATAHRPETHAAPKPNIALDLGPGVGIVEKPAAVREKPMRPPLLLDTRLPGPVLDRTKLDPNAHLLDTYGEPPGPPPDLVQSPPNSASIQNLAGHGLTVTLPVARLLRGMGNAPSN